MEFRRPTSFLLGCQPPLVIVDGVRISAPNHFLETPPLEHIESLTVLSATEAPSSTAWGRLQRGNPGADEETGSGPGPP